MAQKQQIVGESHSSLFLTTAIDFVTKPTIIASHLGNGGDELEAWLQWHGVLETGGNSNTQFMFPISSLDIGVDFCFHPEKFEVITISSVRYWPDQRQKKELLEKYGDDADIQIIEYISAQYQSPKAPGEIFHSYLPLSKVDNEEYGTIAPQFFFDQMVRYRATARFESRKEKAVINN